MFVRVSIDSGFLRLSSAGLRYCLRVSGCIGSYLAFRVYGLITESGYFVRLRGGGWGVGGELSCL